MTETIETVKANVEENILEKEESLLLHELAGTINKVEKESQKSDGSEQSFEILHTKTN